MMKHELFISCDVLKGQAKKKAIPELYPAP